MNAATVPPDMRRSRLVSYADIDTRLVDRADQAVREGARVTADGSNSLYALKLAQERQRIRDGRPESIERAMVANGLISASDVAARAGQAPDAVLPDVRWFVGQTKPAAEAVAIRALCEAGFRACAPTEARWSQVSRKDVVRVRQVFPRYVFVGLVPDARGAIDFRSPRLCDGMAAFVEGAGRRIEVKDTAVGDVMAASERHWIDVISRKAMEEMRKSVRGMARKRFATEGFVNIMADILEADPVSRMRLFVERFGTKNDLRGIEKTTVSET